MDGNGRWADRHGKTTAEGHRAGYTNIERVLRSLAKAGVKEVTLFAFSTENWSRSTAEVDSLMGLLSDGISERAEDYKQQRVRLRHLGDPGVLEPAVREKISEAVAATAANTELTLNVAFNYGGRQEILNAIRRIVDDGIDSASIDDALFGGYLYTAGGTDPDLVVRTGGEFRLSNFLLWQSAYAEFHSTPTLWPDFDAEDVADALRAYAVRQRRFGTRPVADADPG